MTEAAHTVGSFLFDYLHAQGVKHAFGIPGDFALPTFRWLEQSPIELYTMTHEPSVGFAADAYARVTGLGVACVTYCVGGLNLLNAIAGAYAEKSPVLVISGGPSPSDRKADPLLHHKVRSFDTQRRIFEEVTCAHAVLLEPDRAAEEIIRVVEEVKAQCRPGYIEIPYDVVDMPIKPPVLRNRPMPESDAENLGVAIEQAVAMLNAAKKPVIVADIELQRHGLTQYALKLAEQTNIPIVSTLLSKSVVSEKNPLYLGVYSGGLSDKSVQDYVETSDCVLMLGAFLTDVFMGMNTATLQRKRAIIANTEKIRVGHSTFEQVQFRDFLEALLAAPLTRHPFDAKPEPPQAAKPLAKGEESTPLTIAQFFRLLSLYFGAEDTVVCDTGDALLGALSLRTSATNQFLADAYYLSMGFAVPAAIGAIAAQRSNGQDKARVFALVGDGAFQMTGIELSTAAKYGMKPIVFVINNDGYGTQRHILDGPFNNILPWNYTKLTELLGHGESRRVTTCGELDEALRHAIDHPALTLIEVVVPRDDCSPSLRRMGEELGKMRNAEKRF